MLSFLAPRGFLFQSRNISLSFAPCFFYNCLFLSETSDLKVETIFRWGRHVALLWSVSNKSKSISSLFLQVVHLQHVVLTIKLLCCLVNDLRWITCLIDKTRIMFSVVEVSVEAAVFCLLPAIVYKLSIVSSGGRKHLFFIIWKN